MFKQFREIILATRLYNLNYNIKIWPQLHITQINLITSKESTLNLFISFMQSCNKF